MLAVGAVGNVQVVGGVPKGKPGELQRQLYNLKEDRGQNNNRVADSPERADAMAALLEDRIAELGGSPQKKRSPKANPGKRE